MSKSFKVGDKVKVLVNFPNGSGMKRGDIGTVGVVDDYLIDAKITDDMGFHWFIEKRHLALVNPTPIARNPYYHTRPDTILREVDKVTKGYVRKIEALSKNKCTCGAVSVGSSIHSDYCDIDNAIRK